jgi:hypothetical protein
MGFLFQCIQPMKSFHRSHVEFNTIRMDQMPPCGIFSINIELQVDIHAIIATHKVVGNVGTICIPIHPFKNM